MNKKILAKNPVRYIVAVSGGVDSVVLLDMLAKEHPSQLLVAHVDHGIRPESHHDEAFVRGLATTYGLPYETTSLALGSSASEDQAREKRYSFLRQLAKQHGALIATAHHADDVIETIAINIIRGTGWRGLAVMGAKDIHRPLVTMYKADLISYAQRHQLQWREDSTNSSDKYLRNRVRARLRGVSQADKESLLRLWQKQVSIVSEIDTITIQLQTWQRHFYIMASSEVAREVLRSLLAVYAISQTRPQLDAAVLAIKTARPGTKRPLNAHATLYFERNKFSLQMN